ncbi:MAG: dual specificity protein phosphatase family protein [bacterium]|nr:dual specificity protein phosphatase family protein [bacterium]
MSVFRTTEPAAGTMFGQGKQDARCDSARSPTMKDAMNYGTELRRLLQSLRQQGPRLTLMAARDKVERWVTGHPTWRYGRITPQIILGGQPARSLLPRLAELGVSGVLNMRDEYDYFEEVGLAKLAYLRLPTPDNTAPSLENLRQGVTFIQNQLEKSGGVYIHCWEGLGRGPTMVAAYFVSTGMTPDEAWAQIRAVRPFIRPTHEQVQRIEEFARWIVPEMNLAEPSGGQAVQQTDGAEGR